MIGFLVFIVVAVLLIVAISVSMKDNAPTSQRASGLSEGLAFARQHAEQIGDTEAVQAIDNGIYNELLEKRAAERQHASGIVYMTFDIAGINYRKGISGYVYADDLRNGKMHVWLKDYAINVFLNFKSNLKPYMLRKYKNGELMDESDVCALADAIERGEVLRSPFITGICSDIRKE